MDLIGHKLFHHSGKFLNIYQPKMAWLLVAWSPGGLEIKTVPNNQCGLVCTVLSVSCWWPHFTWLPGLETTGDHYL